MAKTSLKNLFLRFVSVVDKGDNPEAKILLTKSKEKNEQKKGGGGMRKLEEIMKELSKEDQEVINTEIAKNDDVAKANEELVKENDDLKVQVETMNKKIKKEVKVEVEPSNEELLKSADPKIIKILEKAKTEAKIEKEKNEKLEKAAAESRAQLRKAEITKEAADYPNLGAPIEDIVEIFSKMDGDKETVEKIKGIFGAVNKALEGTDLLKSIGTEQEPVEKSKIELLSDDAIELMKEDEQLTKEMAEAKLVKQNPSKYLK